MPQQVCNIECAYADLEQMLGCRDWFGGCFLTLGDITICATLSTLNSLVPIDYQRLKLEMSSIILSVGVKIMHG